MIERGRGERREEGRVERRERGRERLIYKYIEKEFTDDSQEILACARLGLHLNFAL